MSKQKKGTTTNMTKLVSWDIDLYNSMSEEEDCLIWLSERDKYLLKNALRQVEWSTRWTSEIDTAQPNREQIAEEMAFKLSQEYCVDICQLIIDCIDDEESGVAQAIINTVVNSSSTEIIDTAQGQDGLIFGDGSNDGCDKDVLWGGVNNLVDQLDVNNQDALQILEVATNTLEWVTDVMAGILGVKAPIIQSALEWGLYIQNNILENYEAQITTEYMDTVKCDLFCIAKDKDCVLTTQDLVDYFFDRLSSQLTFQSLLTESLEFIVLGVWSGSEIADAMMLSQLVFRAQFGQWFDDVAFRSIDLDMRLGYDDPSTDWELLCDQCPDEWTFTIGETGELFSDWSQYAPLGIVDTGNNWLINGGTQDRTEFTLPVGFFDTGECDRIVVTYYQGRNANTADFFIQDSTSTLYIRDSELGDKTADLTITTPIDENSHLLVGIDVGIVGGGGFICRIKTITYYGTGTSPFE